MPWPPVYTGGQHNYQIRSIDIVPIEPSIREGEKLITSIYGPPATLPLYRFPPLNTVQPVISGPAEIPGVLTCSDGVWTGSPTPQLYFQWMANGIDIPGATSNTFTTTLAQDGTTITCEVRGDNGIGEDYALSSNGIAVSLIEPIELDQMESYVISGRTQLSHMVKTNQRAMYVSGVSALDRTDINRAVTYFTTGTSAIDRDDVNYMHTHLITGTGAEDAHRVLNSEIYVLNPEFQGTLVSGEPQSLLLKNADASLGTEGWTAELGVISYSTTAQASGYSFYGGPAGASYRSVYQDAVMHPSWYTDIDAGSCNLELWWYQRSAAGLDQANIRVEYFDAVDASLGTDNGGGLWASPSGIFYLIDYDSPIPVGTRKVRVFLEFQLQSGSTLDAYIDEVDVNIRKGARLTDRQYGPTFEYWRLRFTVAASNSGAALSELELRDGIGGTDLCTGGTPLFGSAGQGVVNADYAFDDIRNTGYWAGANGAISTGTSWLGYQLPVAAKPVEIDITAKQVGLNDMAREFYLEGSDDGLNWIGVQKYEYYQVGDFLASEQKQFVIANGAFGYVKDDAASEALWTKAYTNDSNDHLQKGWVFQSKTRHTVTHVAAYLDDQAFDYKMYLCSINTQKGSFGMVYKILEEVSATSSGVLGWVEHALVGTHEFEVDDMFAVIFVDLNNPTNPEDSNEARVYHVSDWNGGATFQSLRPEATYLWRWVNAGTTLAIGTTNDSNYNRDYLVDFKGSVY